jgi:hypothetical protein
VFGAKVILATMICLPWLFGVFPNDDRERVPE